MELRDPEEITLTDGNGKERKFILSKFSAWDGLEIIERIPAAVLSSTFPKIDDWQTTPELKLKIMKHVAIDINGQKIPLVTKELIENHCGDWKCLAMLLWREVEYNKGFFSGETISTFFANTAHQYLAKISEILIQSSAPSSMQEKQNSTN